MRGSLRREQRARGSAVRAGCAYRTGLYPRGFSKRKARLTREQLLAFLATALDWVNHSIRSNRRSDGLYHAYNLIRFDTPTKLPIRRLYERLEGPVAALSSGHLPAEQSLALLAALKRSRMYRADQHSYLLYPNRNLPRFVERNNLPPQDLRRSKLLQKLLADGNPERIERDVTGRVHFHPAITNARDVCRILEQLPGNRYARWVKRDAALVLEIFERLFDHESFTGRSGTFSGYEGLSSIYWHMVSKLLLTVQETYFRALDCGTPAKVLQGLADRDYDIRAGIGDSKTPEVCGAFPMDPCSHTPAQAGARQPGRTGQVKEDVICRFGELGVRVTGGEIHFCPQFLRRKEFVTGRTEFAYYDVAGVRQRMRLHAGELAFTYCQVPVVYRQTQKNSLIVWRANGAKRQSESLRLDAATSREVLERTGKVARIEVWLTVYSKPTADSHSFRTLAIVPRSARRVTSVPWGPALSSPSKQIECASRPASGSLRPLSGLSAGTAAPAGRAIEMNNQNAKTCS